jgi:hypothetical protein
MTPTVEKAMAFSCLCINQETILLATMKTRTTIIMDSTAVVGSIHILNFSLHANQELLLWWQNQ